jgi:ubiquinone/menaquinone biosynthesis C-methylase UbiE
MPRQDTLWEQFLKPIARLVIDSGEIETLAKARDWERESDRFRLKNFIYPDYYLSRDFHGIEGGYLVSGAALTYDAVTRYALPPNETWVRESVVRAIGGQPRRILDLGCGTGSTALLLQKAFPDAEITGLDLSPYMLAMADYKARREGLSLRWVQGNAEKTGFPDRSFDVVTASLLFHETPAIASRNILRECFRLLTPGGQAIVLDGNQKVLRQTEWLMNIFEEPYIHEYAGDSLEAWFGSANFVGVRTEEVWWTNQLTRGIKPNPLAEGAPLAIAEPESAPFASELSPAF